MSRLKTALSVTVIAALLVVAADYASYAATGQSLLLGRRNTADQVTVLKRTTDGAALKVRTSSKTDSPFVVNGHGKVKHLNADRLDGKNAKQIAPHVLQYTVNTTSGISNSVAFDVPVPAGTYLASYELALDSTAPVECFLYMTNPTYRAATDYSSPNGTNIVWASATDLITVPSGATVQIQCSGTNTVNFTDLVAGANSVNFVPLDHVTSAAIN